MNRTTLGFVALVIAGAVAPLLGVYPTFLMKCWAFALFACAFNLLLGFTGLLSFGHAAFFGAAAYVAGYSIKEWGVTPEVGILSGMVFAALLGWVFGSLAIRRAGIYFAMITLALAQMLYFVLLQMKFLGGEDGLQGVPRGKLFGVIDLADNLNLYYFVFAVFLFGLIDLADSMNLYYVVFGIFLAGFFLIYRTINSPFGQVLKSIRENEPRAISLGYDVARYKLLAFILSAGLAGLAGATKTVVFQLASLTDAHWHTSGEVVLMTLLGGLGTVFGPVVGAFVIVGLQNQLADKVGSWVQVIMGVIFVICVLAFRRGIVGELMALFKKSRA